MRDGTHMNAPHPYPHPHPTPTRPRTSKQSNKTKPAYLKKTPEDKPAIKRSETGTFGVLVEIDLLG